MNRDSHNRATVLAIDSDALARTALQLMLEDSESEISLIGTFSSVASALKEIERNAPQVVLLDLDLSSQSSFSGIRQVRQIKSVSPTSACLILTATDPNPDEATDIIWAGAERCFRKGFLSRDELVRTISELAQGQTEISQVMAHRLLQTIRSNQTGNTSHVVDLKLTWTETVALEQAATGTAASQIAAELRISVSTVKRLFFNVVSRLHGSVSYWT